jgi:hypothetical protein
MTHKPTILTVACLVSATALLAGAPLAQARPRATPAKLKVKPGDVMVNTSVTVKGKGFAPKSLVTLSECGRTFWLVPEELCNTDNAVTVLTTARGSFVTSMKAQVCPKGMPGKAITERTCYIGVQKFTEDTVTLAPAAKLIVTYP